MFFELFISYGNHSNNCPIHDEDTFISLLSCFHDKYRVFAVLDEFDNWDYYLFDDCYFYRFACSSELFKDLIDSYF